MRMAISVEVAAPPDQVWDLIAGVEAWPEWTPSVSRVERLGDGPLGGGSRVRVEQPQQQPAVWTVTEFRPGREFAWESYSPGIRHVARRFVVPLGDRASEVTLEVEATGIGSVLLAPWVARLARRSLALEAAGLKHRAEERAAVAA
jgi:uncharacterized protein YndB with AHSA1/START domain